MLKSLNIEFYYNICKKKQHTSYNNISMHNKTIDVVNNDVQFLKFIFLTFWWFNFSCPKGKVLPAILWTGLLLLCIGYHITTAYRSPWRTIIYKQQSPSSLFKFMYKKIQFWSPSFSQKLHCTIIYWTLNNYKTFNRGCGNSKGDVVAHWLSTRLRMQRFWVRIPGIPQRLARTGGSVL